MKPNIGCIAAILLCLTGCASVSPPLPGGAVAMAPGLVLQLPPLEALGRKVEVVQNVVARYGSQTIAFEGRISATPEGFVMVCSDALGRRAVSVNWTKMGVIYDVADWVPASLRPQNMLADLIVMYWPQEVVSAALPGATVTTSATGRTVVQDGKVLMQVAYAPATAGDIWTGQTRYRNTLWNYSLTIDQAALEP